MRVVLVDNGSLEPAAHAAMRAVAAAIGRASGLPVEAVSWRHSDRIPAEALTDGAAHTLAPWIRAQVSSGEREFLFLPFFISPQGAIGSALRGDLVRLQDETGGFAFTFADGLAESGRLAAIVAERVREAVAADGLVLPSLVVVDHGGPSRVSAEVRDRVADAVRAELGDLVRDVRAASMESPAGPSYDFNRPLLADALAATGEGTVLIAPLFLLPGRHAGPGGDLERIAGEAARRFPGLRCRFTGLVGSHPAATEALADAVIRALGAPAPS